MQFVPLSNPMPDILAKYFIHPKVHYRHYQKVFKFQNQQEKLYIQHFYTHHKHNMKRLQQGLHVLIKTHSTLSAELANEQQRIRKCQTYLSYYEGKMKSNNSNNFSQNTSKKVLPANINNNKNNYMANYKRASCRFIMEPCSSSPTLSTNNSNNSIIDNNDSNQTFTRQMVTSNVAGIRRQLSVHSRATIPVQKLSCTQLKYHSALASRSSSLNTTTDENKTSNNTSNQDPKYLANISNQSVISGQVLVHFRAPLPVQKLRRSQIIR